MEPKLLKPPSLSKDTLNTSANFNNMKGSEKLSRKVKRGNTLNSENYRSDLMKSERKTVLISHMSELEQLENRFRNFKEELNK